MTQDLITFLPWDTAHFGVRVARSNLRELDAKSAERLMTACREQDIDCLYFLADSGDQPTVRQLQGCGFDLVDVRVTRDLSLKAPLTMPRVEGVAFRLLQPSDVDPLIAMSQNLITVSRFFSDRHFDKAKVASMYEIWLEKSLTSDFADAVIVAELGGRPAGFATCLLNRPPGQGNAALVGVAEFARGRRLGSPLLVAGGAWFREQGMHTASVITQGQNIAAQRMYEHAGFRMRRTELWFHKWFNDS